MFDISGGVLSILERFTVGDTPESDTSCEYTDAELTKNPRLIKPRIINGFEKYFMGK
jgi:hypothetical protein